MEMIIKSIYLRNIRTHRESFVDFVRGTNVIVGETGSGKSSIRYAIEFGLFGECGGVSREALITAGEKEGEIVLVIDCGGKSYSIKRVLERDDDGTIRSSAALMDSSGKIIETGVKKVNEAIEEITGCTGELFRLVNPLQGEVRNIIKLPPSERARLIDTILGIGRFRQAYDNMREILSPLKSKIDYLAGEVRAVEKILTNTGEIDHLKEKYSELRKALDDVVAQLRTLEEKKKLAEDYVNAQKRAAVLNQMIKNVVERINSASEEKKTILADLSVLKTRLGELNDNIAKKTVERDALTKELEEVKSHIVLLERNAASLSKMVDLLRSQAGELKTKRVCPVCFRSVSDEQIQHILSRVEEQLRKADGELTEHKNQLGLLISREKDVGTKLENVKNELAFLASTISSTSATINERERKLVDIDARLAESNRELANLKKELAEVQATLEKMGAISGSVLDDYAEKKVRYTEITKEMRDLEEKIRIIEQARKSKVLLEKLSCAYDELSVIRELIIEVVPLVRRWYLNILANEMNYLLPAVGHILRTSNILVTDDYMPVIERAGRRYPAVDLSGGESLLVTILFRLCLARLLSRRLAGAEMEAIILDEPVEMGLSDTAVSSLVDLLHAIKLPQLIIITYNQEIKKAADITYEVVLRLDGSSEVLRI